MSKGTPLGQTLFIYELLLLKGADPVNLTSEWISSNLSL